MDDMDTAADTAELFRSIAENKARQACAVLDTGESGECIECGHEFSRLVNGRCGRCRDELKLP